MAKKTIKKFAPLGWVQKPEKMEKNYHKRPFVGGEFRKYLAENFLSKRTIEEYVKFINYFFREYDDLNEENARKFLYKRKRNYVKAALLWYAKYKGIHLELPKFNEPERKLKNRVERPEIRKQLDQLKRELDAPEVMVLEILFWTGKRISEVLNLKCRDVKEDGIHFKLKGGYLQKIPIPEYLSKKLNKFKKGGWLYEDLFYPKVKPENKYRVFKSRAGNLKLKTHDFRRAMINHLIETTDILTARDYIGHKKLDTTMSYLSEQSREKRVQRAFEVLKNG